MHKQRVKKVKQIMLEKGIDSLLISNFYNIFYLTGFKTLTENEREAFVLITKNKIFLFTDARYIDDDYELPHFAKATRGKRITDYELKLIEPHKGLTFHLQEIIKTEEIKTLAFEAEDLRFYEYKKLKDVFKDLTLTSIDKLVVKIREIKDEEEINYIQKACEIGDQCLGQIIKTIKVGNSEKEIAFRIEMWLKRQGFDIAFDPIVAIDANSSIAHYNTKDGDGIVKKGSVILIDFGARYKNYVSDITRMVFLGKPKDEVRNIYEILKKAQATAIEKISDFENLKEVDDFCRSQITNPSTSLRTSRLPTYPHSTGHGVGLEIHEYPKVAFNSPDRKTANQVFTIEPGVYFPGKFGMRVEDTVAIGSDLRPIILTKSPKSLTKI